MPVSLNTSLILLFFLFSANRAFSQCPVSSIVEEAKQEMDPEHLYDGFSMTNFTMDDKKKRSHVKFVALKGQYYKIYFCNSGFTEEVRISAYKEEKDGSLSKDLLGTTTVKDEFIELVISKAGNYIFEYHIPPCQDAEFGARKSVCMVALITYKK